MAHTNYGEVRQLFETFTRVWQAGGKTTLHLHTQDGQARATLDIQLGPPADPRPGAPEVRSEGPGPSHGPQHHLQQHQRRPRQRGPAARARDQLRRAAWLQQHEEKQQPATAEGEHSDTDIVISHDVNTVSTKILESSDVGEAEKNDTDIVISSAVDGDKTPPTIPFSCDLCEFVGTSSSDLKVHKHRKHNDIPQLDGEFSEGRQTDCWWEKKFKNPLKVFQVFKDVLLDIDDSPLTEEEKSVERENVTNARKEARGSNF